MSINDETLEVKKILLNEKEFFKKVTPDEMMIFIEEHFKQHADRRERYYCKNIKIYNLGLDRELENKLFDEKIMSDIWDFVIMDRITDWKTQQRMDIYQMGRCGGWLYADNAKVHDFNNYESMKQTGETDDEYEDRIYPLRGLFETLWNFEIWYQEVFEDVKAYLEEAKIDEIKEE